MAGDEEVDAYNDEAWKATFSGIDESFINRVLSLGVDKGLVLDVGCGPGQIPIKLVKRNPNLKIFGIDLSEGMLLKAAQLSFNEHLEEKLVFQTGNAEDIPFDDNSFDMVLCNSLMHHASDPVKVLNEIDRVCKPEGTVLIRDLRRPPFFIELFISYNGRHYKGLLKKLYEDSVRAAYSKKELCSILEQSGLGRASIFTHGITHIGIERPYLLYRAK